MKETRESIYDSVFWNIYTLRPSQHGQIKFTVLTGPPGRQKLCFVAQEPSDKDT